MRAADVPAGITQLVSLVGEPLADPAWLPEALLARHAAKSVRVVLVGEGADELFGGYPTYIGAQYADAFHALPPVARRLLRRLVHALPITERKVTLSFLLKHFVDGAELETLARHRLWTSSIPPGTLERLGIPPAHERAEPAWSGEALDHVQRWDFETSLAEGLLTKADRAGMSSALELRAPFLDVAVMELAARLPKWERTSGPHTKVFLKRYAARYLPRWCVRRRKRGLSVPLSGWLKGPLYPWADERLRSERLAGVGIRPGVAAQLLAEHRAGRLDHARSIWTLLVLVEWLDWFERRSGG
jgi:asparagine synthase (glutamine-hydrolysing)